MKLCRFQHRTNRQWTNWIRIVIGLIRAIWFRGCLLRDLIWTGGVSLHWMTRLENCTIRFSVAFPASNRITKYLISVSRNRAIKINIYLLTCLQFSASEITYMYSVSGGALNSVCSSVVCLLLVIKCLKLKIATNIEITKFRKNANLKD